jgi:predicted O-methyltransferase YrrM
MDAAVWAVIEELAGQAASHDSGEADRLRRWRVLEVDAGRFLWFFAQALGARDIVEIGTSRGMSTLWLADVARVTHGRVVSIDVDAEAQAAAAANLERAGLVEHVAFSLGDGGAALAALPDDSVDLLFLDAERTEYPSWWPHPSRVLRPGGVLVADNALSHPDEIEPLRALIARDSRFTTTTLEVGKGELMALKRR